MTASQPQIRTAAAWLFFGIFLLTACVAPAMGELKPTNPRLETHTLQPTSVAVQETREQDFQPEIIRSHAANLTATPTRLNIPPTPVLSTPTAPPQPTPLFPAPLSEAGPWLVLAHDEVLVNAGPKFSVMNVDGSGLQPLPLPDLPADRAWAFLSEPSGPFIAFRTLPINTGFADLRADGLDDFVWIVKLPENELVRKIQLIGDSAWELIAQARETDETSFEGGYELPTQLGLTANPYSFRWSPHGRYLTFSAALDGDGTDLYLYDTQTDTIRRLTDGRTGAQVWFWSPDGSTVFYRNGLLTGSEFFCPDLVHIDGVYALNLFSGERRLYDPGSDYWERIAGITEEAILVHDLYFESSPSDLRLVNYKTGSIRFLYPGSYTDVAMDADGENILLLFDPNFPFGGDYEGITPGIYQYNQNSGALDFLREGSSQVSYLAEINPFYTFVQGESGIDDLVLFSPTNREDLRIPDASQPNPSPNGQMFTVHTSDYLELYTVSGDLITKINRGGAWWFPDSSGFFLVTCKDIQPFTRETGWQGGKKTSFECDKLYLVPPAQ